MEEKTNIAKPQRVKYIILHVLQYNNFVLKNSMYCKTITINDTTRVHTCLDSFISYGIISNTSYFILNSNI